MSELGWDDIGGGFLAYFLKIFEKLSSLDPSKADSFDMSMPASINSKKAVNFSIAKSPFAFAESLQRLIFVIR